MRCDEFSELSGLLLDEALDVQSREAVAAHLGDCPDCRRAFDQMRHLTGLIRRTPASALPAGLWSAIEQRLDAPAASDHTLSQASREASRRTRPERRSFAFRRSWMAAAIAFLAAGLGVFAWSGFLEHPALAAEIDFRPLLERADGDLSAGIRDLLRIYGGRAVTVRAAAREMRVRVDAPPEIAGGMHLRGVYLLQMGRHHRSLAFHYTGDRGQLLLLQCPAGVRKEYGNFECLPCRIDGHAGEAVRAGPLYLTHMASDNVCICIVTTLDETKQLPAALADIRIDF